MRKLLLILLIYTSLWGEIRASGLISSITQVKVDSLKSFFKIENPEIIGKLEVDNYVIHLVYGEKREDTFFEQNLYLFVQGNEKLKKQFQTKRYSLAGSTFDFMDELIAEYRVFYGEILPNYKNAIIWVQKELSEDEKWIQSNYILDFSKGAIEEIRSKTKAVDIKKIINNKAQGKCKQLKNYDVYCDP